MSSKDTVLFKVRVQGGQAAKEFEQVNAAAGKAAHGGKAAAQELDQANTSAGKAAEQFRRTTSGLGADAASLSRSLAGIAGGLLSRAVAGAGAGVASFVESGLGLNAGLESARISFGGLLGDMSKADPFVERLRGVASDSPLKLSDVMGSGKALLGSGMNADQAEATLRSSSTANTAMGGDAEQFKQINGVLGQINAKGQIFEKDLGQLAAIGIPASEILAKKLNLTGKEVANIGEHGVSSADALWALTSGWDEQFGEAADRARGSWSYQMGRMGGDWEEFKRVTTEPLFDWAKDNVLPDLSKTLQNATKTFGREDIDLGEKLRISWKDAKRDLGPLANELKDAIGSLDLDTHIGDALKEHGPAVASAITSWAADAAYQATKKVVPAIGKGLWEAFKEMSWGGKALTVAFLWNRLRLPFWGLGLKGAKQLGKGLMAGAKYLRGPGRMLGGVLGAGLTTAVGAAMELFLGDSKKDDDKAKKSKKSKKKASKRSTPKPGVPPLPVGKGGKVEKPKPSLGGKLLRGGGKLLRGGSALGWAYTLGAGADDLFNNMRYGWGTSDEEKKRRAAMDPMNWMPGATPPVFGNPWERLTGAVRQGPLGQLYEQTTGIRGAVADGIGGAAGRVADGASGFVRGLGRLVVGRAKGGTVRPGELTLWGEAGPEVARFPSGTQITSNRELRAQAAGRPGHVRREVVREQPINLYLDGRQFYQAMSRQTEIEELRR